MNGVLFIRGIPESLKRDFKTACAKVGVSMTDAITGLMQGWVHGQEGKECNPSTNSSEPGTSPKPPTDTSTSDKAGLS